VNKKTLKKPAYEASLSHLIPDIVCKANSHVVSPLLVGLVENHLLWPAMVQQLRDKSKCAAAPLIDIYALEILGYVS
jgi:hypothetical protein